MWTVSLLFILLYISCALSVERKVYWLPNKSINLAINFQDEQLPCSGQNIVFPETLEEGILIAGLSVSGLILPLDGTIVFEEDGLTLGPDPKDNCTRVGDSFYKDDQISSWAQPEVWSSSRFNKATPDAERIPCYEDTVIFPEKGQYVVKLPDQPQTVNVVFKGYPGRILDVDQLIDGQTSDQSQQFIVSEPGMLTTTYDKSSSRPCRSTLPGCPCQDYPLKIECNLKYCPPPRCSYPIKPEGHCCELCGASLLIEVTKDFDMRSFKHSVKNVIESYGLDNFDYHVGLLPHKNGDTKQSEKVQVIVMDKGEYTGKCKEVMSDIKYTTSGDTVMSNLLLYSGTPSSQSNLGWKIVFIVFFLVVIMMGGLFGYYYKWSPSHLNELRGGVARDVMSRLRRRTESVMSLARRDSAVSTGTMDMGFRNPMYSSIRERVQVAEAVNEE